MILPACASLMPGNVFSSARLAELMSTNGALVGALPFALDADWLAAGALAAAALLSSARAGPAASSSCCAQGNRYQAVFH